MFLLRGFPARSCLGTFAHDAPPSCRGCKSSWMGPALLLVVHGGSGIGRKLSLPRDRYRRQPCRCFSRERRELGSRCCYIWNLNPLVTCTGRLTAAWDICWDPFGVEVPVADRIRTGGGIPRTTLQLRPWLSY